jgi:hypothetical protein
VKFTPRRDGRLRVTIHTAHHLTVGEIASILAWAKVRGRAWDLPDDPAEWRLRKVREVVTRALQDSGADAGSEWDAEMPVEVAAEIMAEVVAAVRRLYPDRADDPSLKEFMESQTPRFEDPWHPGTSQ